MHIVPLPLDGLREVFTSAAVADSESILHSFHFCKSFHSSPTSISGESPKYFNFHSKPEVFSLTISIAFIYHSPKHSPKNDVYKELHKDIFNFFGDQRKLGKTKQIRV